MKFSLVREGLFDPRRLEAWTAEKRERIRRGVVKGMQEGASRIVPKVRAQAASALAIRKPGVLKTFSAKVHAVRKDILPVVDFYSRIPWMGLHQRGGIVRGKGAGLLIPLTEEGRRIGRNAFRRIIDGLIRQGNAFFKNVNGKTILFAEQIPESGRYLSRFRKAYRQRQGLTRGKRLSRAIELPIAVLVPQVEIRKRLRLWETVRENLPLIARAIEDNIANG